MWSDYQKKVKLFVFIETPTSFHINIKIRYKKSSFREQYSNYGALNQLIQSLGDDNFEVRKEIEKALKIIEPEWMNLLSFLTF
jgi:hypothetical protein